MFASYISSRSFRQAVIDTCRANGLPYHLDSIVTTGEALQDLVERGVMADVVTNREGLEWSDWFAASGQCSVMSGRDSAARRACELTLARAWLAGEDPTEYRA